MEVTIAEFFKNVAVPEFLKSEFLKPDWYLVIGKLSSLIEAHVPTSELKTTNPTLKVTGKVYIGANCKISDYVVIEGPVYIGDNVEIGPHAEIRPGSVISNNCIVAHAAEIKNSVLMENSRVSNHAMVGDSIIGSNARMGGHSETTNRRFDQQEIPFSYQDQKIATGLDKLGLILGEGSRIGGGVFTAPGCMIGSNTFVSAPHVNGYVPANKFVKSKSDFEIVDNNFNGELKKPGSIIS